MRKIIEEICKSLMSPNLTCEVLSVDKGANTCDVKPLNGGADIYDVQLRADNGGSKGQIIYPSVKSLVLVSPLDGDKANFYVAMFSDVDEVVCEISDTRMITGKDGVLIAKGNDGLKEVMNEMVNQMLKIYAPKDVPGLTKLKTRIKNLLKDA